MLLQLQSRHNLRSLPQLCRAKFWAAKKANQYHPSPNPTSAHALQKTKGEEEGAGAQRKTTDSGREKEKKLKHLYSETLQLPKTKFEIAANAEKRQELFRKRCTEDLYKWQAEQVDRPEFVLHDGPPYANGTLHIGHTVNKVLKDIAIRYQVTRGKRVHYVPGWDCHGLPIEQKVGGKFPGLSPSEIPPLEMRKACKMEAWKAIAEQREDFKLYGIMSDWSEENTYRTLDSQYEMRQLKIFGEMVRKGLIYRANRPTYWSPSSQTALAEAELEFNANYSSRSVYVRFPLEVGPSLAKTANESKAVDIVMKQVLAGKRKICAIIWTTTAWTMPSNMALNVNPKLSYSLVEVTSGPCFGELFVVATDLVEDFKKVKIGLSEVGSKSRPTIEGVSELVRFPGSTLLDSTYRHAFLSLEAKGRPILAAEYVTAESGTGLVHSAPGHGLDDYHVWQAYARQNTAATKEEIISPVDNRGVYTRDLDKILNDCELMDEEYPTGKTVLGTGGKEIVRLLNRSGYLLGENPIQHSYPHDWRSKLPVITRTTSQWFANLEPIKEAAIASLSKVKFVPESGRGRLEAFVRGRNEWCISRQRSWGVPIPVVYSAKTGKALLSAVNVEHITRVLQEKGTDYWWQGDAREFVAPEEQKEGVDWIKGTDTMDVWFDSGTSWSLLPGSQNQTKSVDSLFSSPPTSPANVYLEGSDQHRGWFQSSLLTYIATASTKEYVAPYQMVVTHGFTVDRKGQKMSKSVGNVISPNFFLLGGAKTKEPAYGADVLRWWVGRVDFTKEIVVSSLVIKHASDELRKVRNTIRFLLANLPPPEEVPSIDSVELELLERYIMHELLEMNEACQVAYDDFDFAQIPRRMAEFGNGTVSAIYLDIIKDSIYNDAKDSKRRASIIAVLHHILRSFLSIIAPIVPHLAEEVFHYYKGATKDPASKDEPANSIFQQPWHLVPEIEGSELARSDMKEILVFRNNLLTKVEEARQRQFVKNSTQIQVHIAIPYSVTGITANVADILKRNLAELTRILNVSDLQIVEELPERQMNDEAGLWHLTGVSTSGLEFLIEPAKDHQCPRCWKHNSKEKGKVCSRCAEVLKSLPTKTQNLHVDG